MNMNHSDDLLAQRSEWLEKINSFHFVEQLFCHLPDVSFFAKDCDGHFTMADISFIQMLHCDRMEEVLGKTDKDFFLDHVAKKYMADDQNVIKSGEPMLHEIEMVPKDDFTLDWHEANKFPIFDEKGHVIGVAGITIKLSPAHLPLNYPPNLGDILEFIGKNFGNKITIKQLAEIANMSERSLERHFTKTFKTTPRRYIKQVRMNAACYALANTSKSISEITLECGFCDQSHMSSEFRRILNVTPREYRIKNTRK